MRLKKDSSEQKLRGAYYTPLQLAKAMVEFFAPQSVQTVLEPSCGDGVFLDSLVLSGLFESIKRIDAVEIEPDEATKVKENYDNKDSVHVYCEDFFEYYTRALNKQTYDLIVGNPPYIRYQYFTEHQRELQSMILKTHGMKANKLINAWVAFLVACVQLLSETGTIAFVIPAEILQVAYAEDLRLFLSEHLDRITLITFEQLVFPDIEQEIVVFVGERGGEGKGIRIIEMNNLEGFKTLDLSANGFQEVQHVKEKWTKYFVTAREMQLIKRIRQDSRFAKFAEYGLINVGVTTGNNSYFSITEEVCDEYEMSSVTLPLIGRSSHAHGIFFTKEDWEANKAAKKRARLISFPDIPYDEYPTKHKEYILAGEAAGENEGYKCSIRDRWYIVPSVWIPDAFFLRRNNLYPKFVLNRCGAVSTDTMHRMKFNEGVNPDNVLLAYYNSVSFAFTEICGRSYGGGVLEILPGEMGNIMIPVLDGISVDVRDDLLREVDRIVREEGNIEEALDLVDQEALVNHLGIDPAWCSECRVIWKKLQKRRLERGEQ